MLNQLVEALERLIGLLMHILRVHLGTLVIDVLLEKNMLPIQILLIVRVQIWGECSVILLLWAFEPCMGLYLFFY